MSSFESEPRRVGTIWTLSLDQPIPTIKPLVEVSFYRLGPEWAGALAEAAAVVASTQEEDRPEIQERFDAGSRCYSAWAQSKLAAYGWVSYGEGCVGELGLALTLPPCEAYLWDCATLPAYRQKYLYSSLLTFILQELKKEGLCRAWIGADADNLPSQKGIDRAGFQRVGDLAEMISPGDRQFVVLPYPGVPDELLQSARQVFLGKTLAGT